VLGGSVAGLQKALTQDGCARFGLAHVTRCPLRSWPSMQVQGQPSKPAGWSPQGLQRFASTGRQKHGRHGRRVARPLQDVSRGGRNALPDVDREVTMPCQTTGY